MSPREALKTYFGFDGFRPLQEEIIDSVLVGKDTLALMPTGGGKSICFQVPTLVMAHDHPDQRLCLVITPLIALMRDQVANLEARGIHAAAVYTGMSYDKQRWIIASTDRIISSIVVPNDLSRKSSANGLPTCLSD